MAKRSKELIVRALVEVIVGSTTPITAWAPLVFLNPKSDVERLAQVTAFPILYGCIRDIVEAGHEKVVKIAKEAEKEGLGSLSMNAIQFSERCNLALPILETFNEEEQIIVALLRDRLAHGYLGGTSNKTRRVKIIRDRKVKCIEFDRDYLVELKEKHFSNDNLLDIVPMINRISDAFDDYLPKIEEYNISIDALTEALMSGGIVVFEKN